MTITDPFRPATPVAARGACGTCGHEGLLSRDGTPGRHYQMRIRRGANGEPQEYPSDVWCPGAQDPAEPLEPSPPPRCAYARCGREFEPRNERQVYCQSNCQKYDSKARQSAGST